MTGRPTTWRDILNELCASIGYHSVWFDGDGLPRVEPQPVLATAVPDVVYETAADGVLLSPMRTATRYDRLANRVHVASTAAGVLTPLYATADADDEYPGHPLSQAVCSQYFDHEAENSVSGDLADLQVQASNLLAQLLSAYQTAALQTLAWPVHECFDIVGIRIDDDAEFDTEQTFHERRWDLDLGTGVMHHDLRRIAT